MYTPYSNCVCVPLDFESEASSGLEQVGFTVKPCSLVDLPIPSQEKAQAKQSTMFAIVGTVEHNSIAEKLGIKVGDVVGRLTKEGSKFSLCRHDILTKLFLQPKRPVTLILIRYDESLLTSPSNTKDKTMSLCEYHDWSLMFLKLKNFQEHHGHCNVQDDPPLCFWVEQQRMFQDQLEKDKLAKLFNLGFDFGDSPCAIIQRWMDAIQVWKDKNKTTAQDADASQEQNTQTIKKTGLTRIPNFSLDSLYVGKADSSSSSSEKPVAKRVRFSATSDFQERPAKRIKTMHNVDIANEEKVRLKEQIEVLKTENSKLQTKLHESYETMKHMHVKQEMMEEWVVRIHETVVQGPMKLLQGL